jgi:ABC-type multidrug transport system ATPase subunit
MRSAADDLRKDRMPTAARIEARLAAEVRGIQKAYGPVTALRGVDLAFRQGGVTVVFGSNGAGKSTLVRILAMLTRPDAGSVTIGGIDAAADGERARQLTGAVLHAPMLYADLTVRENLTFFARLYRIDAHGRVVDVAGRLGIAHRLDDRVRTLSHGLAKRAALARALLHAPSLLLLDEPESGLDQGALAMLDGVLAEFRAPGKAVIMTTHQVERGLERSRRVVVLQQGRVALDEDSSGVSPADVRQAMAAGSRGQ